MDGVPTNQLYVNPLAYALLHGVEVKPEDNLGFELTKRVHNGREVTRLTVRSKKSNS